MATRFQTEISKALERLVPMAPLNEINAIKDIVRKKHLRHLPADIGAWLAVTTHIRHNLTDYDALLDDGYDSDSARHFVLDDMNDVLRSWQSTRFIDPNEDEMRIPKPVKSATTLRDNEPE